VLSQLSYTPIRSSLILNHFMFFTAIALFRRVLREIRSAL